MNEGPRQTGRTTRMLSHASQLAREGKRAVIVALNLRQAAQLKDLVQEDEFLRVVPLGALPRIDWERLEFRCAPQPRTEFLFDHATIEMALHKPLEMMHRFDLPPRKNELAEMRVRLIEEILAAGNITMSDFKAVERVFDSLLKREVA